MPRYFFHIIDGDDLVADDEGRELPGPEEARMEARRSARDVAVQMVGGASDGRMIEIVDETGQRIETLLVRDALSDFRN